jgi:chaperonin GroES
MKIKPLGDHIIVQRIAEKDKIGNIYIPDASKEKPAEGIVVAVGPGAHSGAHLIPLYVKVGDRVLFSKYGGTDVTVGGEDVVFMREGDVIGVLG